MPVAELEALRKDARAFMRGKWSAPEMIKGQEALRGAAIDTGFAACLRKHMEAGTAGRGSYRDCQKEAKLADAYRDLWGKKS